MLSGRLGRRRWKRDKGERVGVGRPPAQAGAGRGCAPARGHMEPGICLESQPASLPGASASCEPLALAGWTPLDGPNPRTHYLRQPVSSLLLFPQPSLPDWLKVLPGGSAHRKVGFQAHGPPPAWSRVGGRCKCIGQPTTGASSFSLTAIPQYIVRNLASLREI